MLGRLSQVLSFADGQDQANHSDNRKSSTNGQHAPNDNLINLINDFKNNLHNLTDADLNFIETSLYKYDEDTSKIIDEKEKMIRQLERGLFAASQTETNIITSTISEELAKKDALLEQLQKTILKYENEIIKLKSIIKEQEDVILAHNNNAFELTNTKDTIIKAKQEAFKVQAEELNKKQKIIDDQQAMIDSLKNKIETLEESFELNKIDLENRLNNKEEDLKNKIETFESNLHYGRKYFEEILDEKEQIIKEKTNEINNLKDELAKKYEDNLQTQQNSINQFINNLKLELNEKTNEIDLLKQQHQNEIQQLVVANQLNTYVDEYYRLFNAKTIELTNELESKQAVISKLKDELSQKEQLLSEKENSIILLNNQLIMSESKLNEAKLLETSMKKLKEKFDYDLKNMKEIHDHQVELHRVKINMLEKTIENYQKGYNELSKSSDAIVNYDSSTIVYKGIIDDIQKSNAQLETEKIDLQVKVSQLNEQIEDLIKQKENLSKKYLAADQERQKYISERDAYNLQHLEILNGKDNEILILSDQFRQLDENYRQIELERDELLNMKLEYEQFQVSYNETTSAYQTLYQQANDLLAANQTLTVDLNNTKRLNDELTQSLEELNIKLDHLERDNAELNRNNIASKLKLEDIKEQLDSKINEINDLNIYKRDLANFNDLNQNIDRLNNEIKDKNELIEQLNQAKDFLETTNSQLLVKNIKMQLYLENMGVNVEHVEKSRVVKEYEDLKQENGELKMKINKLNDEIGLSQPKIEALNMEIVELSQKLNDNETSSKHFNDDFNSLKHKFDKNVRELELKDEYVVKLNKELHELRASYEAKINECNELIHQNSFKNTESNEDLTEFVRNELRLLQNDLSLYILNNQLKYDGLNRKYESEKDKCKKLNEEIEELKSSLNQIKSKKETLKVDLNEQVNIESSNIEAIASNDENRLELELQLSNKNSEINALQEQVQYYYNMLNAYQGELDNRAYQIEALNYELANLKTNNLPADSQESETKCSTSTDLNKNQPSELPQQQQQQQQQQWENDWSEVEQEQQKHYTENIEFYKHEVDSLRSNLDEKLSIIDRLNDQINEINKGISLLKEDNYNLTIKCEEYVKVNKDLYDKLNELSNRLANENQNILEKVDIESKDAINEEAINIKLEPVEWQESSVATATVNVEENKIVESLIPQSTLSDTSVSASTGVNELDQIKSEYEQLRYSFEIQKQYVNEYGYLLNECFNLIQFATNCEVFEINLNEILTKFQSVKQIITQNRAESDELNKQLQEKTLNIESLIEKNETLRNDYNKISDDLNNLTLKQNELEATINDLNKQLELKTNDYSNLELKYTEENQKLNHDLEKQQQQYDLLKKKALKLKEKCKLLETTKSNFSSNSSLNEIDNQAKHSSKIVEVDDALIQQQQQQQEKLIEFEKEIENLKQELNNKTDEVKLAEQRQEEFDALKIEIDNKCRELDDLKQTNLVQQDKLAEYEEKLKALENELNNKVSEIVYYKEAMNHEQQDHQDRLVEYEKNIETLRIEFNETVLALQSREENFKRELENYKEIIQQQQQQQQQSDRNDEYERNIEELKFELINKEAELKQVLQSNQEKIIDYEKQIEVLRNEVDSKSSSNQLGEIETKYKENLIELESLKKKYDTLKGKAHMFKEKLKKYESQPHHDIVDIDQHPQVQIESVTRLTSANREDDKEVLLSELKSKNVALEAELNESNNKIIEANESNKHLMELINELKINNANLDVEVIETGRKLNEISEENKKLTQVIDENKEKRSHLEIELEEILKKFNDLNEENQNLQQLVNEYKVQNDYNNDCIKQLDENLRNELLNKENMKNEYEKLQQKALKLKAMVKGLKASRSSSRALTPTHDEHDHHEHHDHSTLEEAIPNEVVEIKEENNNLKAQLNEKANLINSFNDQLNSLVDENNSLKNEIEKLKEEISDKENQPKNENEWHDWSAETEQNNELVEAKNKITSLEIQLNEVNQKLYEINEENLNLQQLINEYKVQNDYNNDCIKQLDENLRNELLNKENMKNEYEKLQQKALKLKAMVKGLKASRSSSRALTPTHDEHDHHEHHHEHHDHSTLEEAIPNEVVEIKEENNNLKVQLNEKAVLINSLNDQFNSLFDENNSLKNEIEQLKVEISDKENKLKDEKQVGDWSAKTEQNNELVEAETKITSLEVELNEINKKFNDLSEENQNLQQLINEYKVQNDYNNDCIKQLDENLRNELLNKENMKNEYEKLQQKALKLKAMVKGLKASKSSSRALTPTFDENDHHDHSIHEHHVLTSASSDSLGVPHGSHKLATTSTSSIDSEFSELNKKIDDYKEENVKLMNEIHALKLELNQNIGLKDDEINNLKLKIDDLNREFEENTRINENLKNENNKLKDLIMQLEENLKTETNDKLHFKEEYDKLHEKTIKLKSKIKLAKDTKQTKEKCREDSQSSTSNIVDDEHQQQQPRHTNEFEELNKQIEAKNIEIYSLKDEINKLNEKIVEFEVVKAQEIDLKNNELNTLNEQLDKMRKTLINCEPLDQFETLKNENEAFKVELSKKETDIKELENQIKNLKNEVTVILKELALLKKENKNVDDKSKQNDWAESVEAEIPIEIVEMRQENKLCKTQLEEKTQLINNLNEELTILINENINLKNVIEQLQVDASSKQAKTETKSGWGDWETQDEDINKVKDENEQLKADVNDKIEAINKLKAQINDLNNENNNLKEELQQKEKKEGGWNDWSTGEQNNDALKMEIDQLKADLDEKITNVNDLNAIISLLESEIKDLKNENTDLKAKLESSNAEEKSDWNDWGDQSNENSKMQIEELKFDLNDKVDNINNLNSKINELNNEITRLSDENTNLKNQIENVTLNQPATSEWNDCPSQDADVEKYKAEIDQLKKDLNEKTAVIVGLNEKLNLVSNELNVLKNENEHLQNKLDHSQTTESNVLLVEDVNAGEGTQIQEQQQHMSKDSENIEVNYKNEIEQLQLNLNEKSEMINNLNQTLNQLYSELNEVKSKQTRWDDWSMQAEQESTFETQSSKDNENEIENLRKEIRNKEQNISSLNMNIFDLLNQIGNLSEMNNNLKNKISELETKLAVKDETVKVENEQQQQSSPPTDWAESVETEIPLEIVEMRQENKLFKTEIEEKTQLINNLNEKLTILINENTNLKNMIEQLQVDASSKQSKSETTSGWGDWETQDEDINKVKDENELLKADVNDKTEAIYKLTAQVNDLVNENNNLREELKQNESKKEDGGWDDWSAENHNNENLKMEIDQLKADLKEKLTNVDDLNSIISLLDSEIKGLKDENNDLKARLESANVEEKSDWNDWGEQNNENLKMEIDHLRAELNNKVEIINSYNEKISELLNEVSQLKSRISNKEPEVIIDASTTTSELKVGKINLVQQHSNIQENSSDDHLTTINALNNQISEITDEIFKLRLENADLVNKINEYESEISNLNQKLTPLKQDADELLQKIQKYQIEEMLLNDKIIELNKELSNKNEENESLTQKFEDEAANFKEKIETLEKEITSLKFDNDNMIITIGELRQNENKAINDSQQNEITELESQLNEPGSNDVLFADTVPQDVQSQDSLNELQNTLAAIQNENYHLRASLTSLQQQASEMLYDRDVHITNLTNENEILKQELAVVKQPKEELAKTEVNIEEQNNVMSASGDNNDQIVNYENNINELNSVIENLKLENVQLKNDYENLSLKLKENEDLKERINALENEKREIQENSESLRVAYENLTKTFSNLQAEYDEFKVANEKQTTETVAELERLKQNEQTYATLEQENNFFKTNYELIQTQANQMLYERDVKIVELSNEIQDLKQKQSETATESDKLTELENRINNLNEENQNLKLKIETLKDEYDDIIKQSDDEILVLNTNINTLNEKLKLHEAILDENNILKETISTYQLNEVKLNENLNNLNEILSKKDDEINNLKQDKYHNIGHLIETTTKTIDLALTNNNNNDNSTQLNHKQDRLRDIDYLSKRCLFLEEQLRNSRFICEKILKKLEKLKLHNENFNNKYKSIKTMMVNETNTTTSNNNNNEKS